VQDPPLFAQICILGFKTNHLATLLSSRKIGKAGANPTTFEFTITTPAFFKVELNIWFTKTLGYPWRCKNLQRQS
jgi:hypothetical protein